VEAIGCHLTTLHSSTRVVVTTTLETLPLAGRHDIQSGPVIVPTTHLLQTIMGIHVRQAQTSMTGWTQLLRRVRKLRHLLDPRTLEEDHQSDLVDQLIRSIRRLEECEVERTVPVEVSSHTFDAVFQESGREMHRIEIDTCVYDTGTDMRRTVPRAGFRCRVLPDDQTRSVVNFGFAGDPHPSGCERGQHDQHHHESSSHRLAPRS